LFNASYVNNKNNFTIAALENGEKESHKQKALSQQSIRDKNKLKFPKKNTKNKKQNLRNSLKIYEDQRSIKKLKRSLSFLQQSLIDQMNEKESK
jgi:hypothetical protein